MAVPFRSLRTTLIVPFVLLVITVAVGAYWLAYSAAIKAVDDVSDRLVEDAAARVAQATAQHLSTAAAVLNAAVPEGLQRVDETSEIALLTPNTVSAMEQRLWLATGLFGDKYRDVYFASESGRYLALHRDATGGEVRIRARADEPTRAYRALSADKRGEQIREEAFNPHEQGWYRSVLERRAPTWSPVFRDFKTGQLKITYARPVLRPDGGIRGVVATDVSLAALADVVRDLKVGDNAVAYIVEPSGKLISSSHDRELTTRENVADPMLRLRADASSNALIRETFDPLVKTSTDAANGRVGGYEFRGRTFETPSQGETHGAFLFLRDAAGLDWRVAIAIPHGDHLGALNQAMLKGILFGGAAVLVALGLGFWVLRRVAADVESVQRSAQKLISGEGPITRIPEREDEIGALASSVAAIQNALLYDRLTGALNRDAFYRQFDIAVAQLPMDEKLALIFIDLDRFKRVNDRFGHTVGDSVLAKSAERIRRRLRENDLLARFGGDEFVVMFHGKHAVGAIDAMVERLGERLRMGMTIEGHNVSVGASIGVAVFPDDGESLDDLIRIADERMYDKKKLRSVVSALK
jgi:diguanylate cyclase